MQIANFKANGELITSAGSGGGAPTDATYITQTANGSLSAEQALASLSTGLMKVTTTTGVVSSVTDSAGLAGCLSDETGSGAAVFGTSPTIATPRITTSINDSNGNEIISLTATGSAVNNLATTNAAAGGTPALSAVGDDADISIDYNAKGAGRHIFEQNVDLNDKSLLKALYTDLKAAAAPSNPSAGYIRVYADSGNSNHVTQRDSAGTVIDLAASGSGGISTVQENGVNVVTSADLLDFKDFNVEDLGSGDAAVYHNLPGICEGRLTLTTALPVTTADVTAAGTLYFTPYAGNKVSLFDGTRWKVYTFTERSLALTLTSGSVYDVWLYDNAGTLTLETLVWTNTTTRATALALQDGVYVKTGATTRRYLGTIYASGTNTTEDSLLKRFVWNYYNRVERKLQVTDSTDNWSYTTASLRSWNNSAANRVEAVIGVSEDLTFLHFAGVVFTATSGINLGVGIGLDSTSAQSADIATFYSSVGTSGPTMPVTALYRNYTGIGYHFLQLLEFGGTGGTFYGDGGASTIQKSGAIGYIKG